MIDLDDSSGASAGSDIDLCMLLGLEETADFSSKADFLKLVALADRFPKVFAMLATLNFRIKDVAEALTICSLLDRAVIPGNGRTSRVQTSDNIASNLARSPRDGAKTGILLLVVKNDCDRLIRLPDVEPFPSFMPLVFLIITWHNGDLGPIVVARCMEILLAKVPASHLSITLITKIDHDLPGFPKIVPRGLIFNDTELSIAD
jgi:hypothetical protein